MQDGGHDEVNSSQWAQWRAEQGQINVYRDSSGGSIVVVGKSLQSVALEVEQTSTLGKRAKQNGDDISTSKGTRGLVYNAGELSYVACVNSQRCVGCRIHATDAGHNQRQPL